MVHFILSRLLITILEKCVGSFLKSKDQVLDVFKEFHAKVEREIDRKLKSVRANNGGEYKEPLEKYFKVHSIKLKKTPSKIP